MGGADISKPFAPQTLVQVQKELQFQLDYYYYFILFH